MGWGEYEPVRVALEVLRTSGELNPAAIAPALRPALESGMWRDWRHPVTGVRHFDDFDAFIEHETRHTVDVILAALRPDVRAADVITAIETARREGIATANEHDQNRVSNTHPQRRKDAAAVIARLKRDDPELAAEVIAGRITPHAAAKQAGIRRPRATFVTDDIDLAYAALLRHYTAEEIARACRGD